MTRSTRALSLAALAIAFSLVPVAGSRAQKPATPAVIFAVERDEGLSSYWLQPIATLENGDFRPVPASCDEQNAATSAFFARYLAAGRSYRLLYGGKEVGKIISRGHPDAGGSPGSLAEPQLPGRAPARALATNAPLGRPQSRRREPTPAERRQATELARQSFRQHGVSEADLARLRADGVAMADFEGRGEFTLIATFVIPTPEADGIQDSLFFVVKPAAASEPSLLWYDHPAAVSAGEELLFVDQLPLRPGEPDDILVKVAYYRNSSYRIYRFHIINWRPVFDSDVYGCY